MEARDIAKSFERVIQSALTLRSKGTKFNLPGKGKPCEKNKYFHHMAILDSLLRNPGTREHPLFPMLSGLAMSVAGIYRHVPYKAKYTDCFSTITSPYKGTLNRENLRSLGVRAGKLLHRAYKSSLGKKLHVILSKRVLCDNMPILLTSGPWTRPSMLAGWYTTPDVWAKIKTFVQTLDVEDLPY